MLERQLRLYSGLVIAVYVALHLINHSLGLFSVEAMDALRSVIAPIWQNPVGTIALYGSLLVHFVLALRSLYRRDTLRMPLWEAAQLTLGLLIVPMLVAHVVGTRLTRSLLDFDTTYHYVVTILWNDDWYRIKQPALVFVVWGHVTVGLHFWLRLKSWYIKALPFVYAFAILVPVLAVFGFIGAGQQIGEFDASPEVLEQIFGTWSDAGPEQREFVRGLADWGLGIFVGLVLATLLARYLRRFARARHTYRIHHPSGRVLTAQVGQTVLDTIRAARIPHASVCGGRARCTTCRIRVGEGLETLDQPSHLESAALKRIGAEINVRLACQTRPQHDLSITPLLPANAAIEHAYQPGGVQGHEQQVAALFIDLRGSTSLGEEKLPYDVVFILNQFFAEMSAALQHTGGHYAQFAGDGLMALYGLKSGFETSCREALQGAVEMTRRMDALNKRLEAELREPLRIGIGVHGGEAIVGTMGPPRSPNYSAIGDNINIAARLEALSKTYHCTLVVSESTARAAGADLSGFESHIANVRGRGEPVTVYAINDPAELRFINDRETNPGK